MIIKMNKKIIFSFLIIMLICVISSCSPPNLEFSKTEEHMGTIFTIKADHTDSKIAYSAIDSAFSEIERIEALMTTYSASEITTLNTIGQLEGASKETIFVLKKAKYFSEISNGAFDITVKPVLDLYTYTFSELGRAPTEEEIKNELSKVNYEKVGIDGRNVIIAKDMSVTLGGIAKGYAADKAIEILSSYGIKSGLVNAGGDVKALGKKADGNKWIVALQNPRDENEHIAKIGIDNLSVATSGDYERYFDESKQAHHIMNPKTGKSATELISVTIITPQAIDADGLATAVFVLGKEEGLKLVERFKGVEGLIVTKDKEIIKSNGFSEYEIN